MEFPFSNSNNMRKASSLLVLQNNTSGLKSEQTFGRSGWLNIAHEKSSFRFMHRTPDGFPSGIPGIGEEIDGAIQHAPQSRRHSIFTIFGESNKNSACNRKNLNDNYLFAIGYPARRLLTFASCEKRIHRTYRRHRRGAICEESQVETN